MAMVHFCSYFLLLLLFFPIQTYAQQNSARDTVSNKKQMRPSPSGRSSRNKKILTLKDTKIRFNPTKAFLYSVIFPSAGQVYNKKYWKVPIVLGGLAGGALLINLHQSRYYTLKKELYALLRDPSYSPPSGLAEGQLRGGIDRSKRDRDLFAALTVLWYFLQAVEAHVDAHLRFFKVNPRLQVSIEPMIQNNFAGGNSLGIALKIKF